MWLQQPLPLTTGAEAVYISAIYYMLVTGPGPSQAMISLYGYIQRTVTNQTETSDCRMWPCLD